VGNKLKLDLNDVDLLLLRDKIAEMHLTDTEGPKKLLDSLNLFISDPCVLTTDKFFILWGPLLHPIFLRYKIPIVNIAKIIMEVAFTDVDVLEPKLQSNIKDEEERYQKFIDLWIEFICFYMYLSDRIMYNIADSGKRNEFMDLLSNLVADLICKTYPKEIMEHERDLLFAKLNKRHDDYSGSNNLTWEKDKIYDAFTGNSLLSMLSRIIAANCRYDIKEISPGVFVLNLADLMELNIIVCHSYKGIMEDMNLQSLIRKAATSL
jgi:hypothetical protein